MVDAGVDGVLIETVQDLLQAKSAVIAARRAIRASGRDVPLIVNVTVETTGTLLMGSEIGAALTSLRPLGIDVIGLNCATGPAEMSEHLRYLSQHADIPLACMPNAGLPVLTRDGAHYPLTAPELAEAQRRFVSEYGVGLIGGCCGTTPEHITALAETIKDLEPAKRDVQVPAGVSSLYSHVDFDQDASYLSIGERTNANGSRAFRDAMLAGNIDDCIQIARAQTREGSHVLDVCIDYVGRDGAQDMTTIAGELATASTLPIVLDSTETPVLRAGLESLAGRCIINSVNFEDGDGPDSRFSRTMELVREHGAAVIALTIDEQGQARTADHKLEVAKRLVRQLTEDWGMDVGDILLDCLTFTVATGQEESRRDALETIEAIRRVKVEIPGVRTTLGLSNVSFGLSPAARAVLNSVFLHECVEAGPGLRDRARGQDHADQPDLRRAARGRARPRLRPPPRPGPPRRRLRPAAATPGTVHRRQVGRRQGQPGGRTRRDAGGRAPGGRIVDGDRKGLEADLDEALTSKPALEIINDYLLAGMKTVGELFGSGQMQLPFVLQSAEVMKLAVAYLEPHMEKADEGGKGTIVLATVKGDVHDIGKNLVDIILSNNGYRS